ncbi:MAG TPA: hypothetical protein VGE43_19565 [Acidimicrobiales bacterium]
MSDVTPEALAGALARIEALEADLLHADNRCDEVRDDLYAEMQENDRLRAERDAERALADQLANGWWENSDKSLATFNLPAFAAWRAARSEVEQ